VIWSYKLGLGEFDTDGFAGENQLWLWVIWLMATFLLQITFLNMLIAIMSDTYAKVTEVSEQSAMTEKINILSDFHLVLKKFDLKMNFQYIFKIKKRVHISDEDSLESKLGKIYEQVSQGQEKLVADNSARRNEVVHGFARISDEMQSLKVSIDEKMKANMAEI